MLDHMMERLSATGVVTTAGAQRMKRDLEQLALASRLTTEQLAVAAIAYVDEHASRVKSTTYSPPPGWSLVRQLVDILPVKASRRDSLADEVRARIGDSDARLGDAHKAVIVGQIFRHLEDPRNARDSALPRDPDPRENFLRTVMDRHFKYEIPASDRSELANRWHVELGGYSEQQLVRAISRRLGAGQQHPDAKDLRLGSVEPNDPRWHGAVKPTVVNAEDVQRLKDAGIGNL
jgi:hypothetical protein